MCGYSVLKKTIGNKKMKSNHDSICLSVIKLYPHWLSNTPAIRMWRQQNDGGRQGGYLDHKVVIKVVIKVEGWGAGDWGDSLEMRIDISLIASSCTKPAVYVHACYHADVIPSLARINCLHRAPQQKKKVGNIWYQLSGKAVSLHLPVFCSLPCPKAQRVWLLSQCLFTLIICLTCV